MLLVQYEEVLMELVPLPSKLPLNLDCYQALLPLFQHALGIYYFSDYYVARQEVYKSNKVYFKRFVYDLISMFGLHLFYIELATLELLLRRIYQAVTHNFEAGRVFLRRVEDVRPAFTEQEFNEAVELQKKDEQNLNKLHLSISDQRIGNAHAHESNQMIGVNASSEKKPGKRDSMRKETDLGGNLNDDDDDDDDSDGDHAGKDLFSGLLGNGEEDALEIQ